MQKKTRNFRIVKVSCLVIGLLFFFGNSYAQEIDKELQRQRLEVQKLLSDAGEEIVENQFPDAEANYRRTISIDPAEEIGKYNLGNAYYNKEKNDEAMRRFSQAANIAESKVEKHKAFHNLGNTFMNAKDYENAVAAYKSALKNNPADDETRYNFALAKDMLKKNPPKGGDGDDKDEDKKEKDSKEEQDKNENQDKKDDGKEKEGDEGDKKEDDGEGDEEKDKNKGENDKNEGQPDKPKDKKDGEGDKPKEQPNKPIPGQMSPQQIKNLLEAMNNEEKKVQQKMNAKKQKGAKVKPNKDW